MVCIMLVLFGHHLEQFFLDFQYRFSRCQADAVTDTENMRIHRHGGMPECRIEDDIGCFAPHTGQALQRFLLSGTCPPCRSINKLQVAIRFLALL